MMIMIDKKTWVFLGMSQACERMGCLLAVAFLTMGCGSRDGSGQVAGDPKPRQNAAGKLAGPTVTNYTLDGVVRSLVPDTGRVMIAHRAIPGFMGAMTMPFQLADPKELESIHPGDEIQATLRVVKQDGAVTEYQLFDLRVTNPAKPPTVVLDVSKGKLQIREQPKRLEPGDAVPDFAMTLQDGNTQKLSDLRGKTVVLTFIYTRCPMPDFCPLMDRKFSDLAQHLAVNPERAKETRLISLSFDPEHDTPEILRKHAQIRGAIPPLWTYAVASQPELAKIAAPLGLFFGPDGGEIAHNLCTAIIDPRGKLVRLEVGTKPNRWETPDFLKSIDSCISGIKP